MKPLLSVVIANYNYGRFLGEAIDSVLRQSCQDFELILVDGGSTDNSLDVIEEYASRISWWVSEPDKGQSDAFNKGFSHANGRYLTWLNADDVMCPGTIARLKDAVSKNPDCEWFAGGFMWCDPEMRILQCYSAYPLSRIRYEHGVSFVCSPSSFFTKRLLEQAEGVDVRFQYTMDTHLWLRFYFKCGAKYRVFTDYAFGMRMHPDSKMGGHNFENGSYDPKTIVRKSKTITSVDDKKKRQLKLEDSWMQAVHPHKRMSFLQRVLSIHWPSAIKGRLETRKWFGKYYADFFARRDCHGGKDAICQIGVVFPYGNLMSLSRCAVASAKVCPTNYDFYYASLSRDVDSGAWGIVQSGLDSGQIIKRNTLPELGSAIESLFSSHKRVVVHCGGGYGQTKWLMPMIKKYGCRLILVGTTHSFCLDSWKRIPTCLLQLWLYCRYYRKIVFQCKYAVEKFIGSFILFSLGKGMIIPLACEDMLRECASDETKKFENSLEKVLLDQSLFKFVYLAHFRPGKNHVWLVRAISPVFRKHPEARLILCGQDLYGVESKVRAVIKEEGLENQVIMPGVIPRENVPSLLAHVNCAIVASSAETFGFAFIEPMFMGLPIIGTPVGVGREVVRQGHTGNVFRLSSPSSLRKAVKDMLDDPAEAKRMGQNARTCVLSHFTYVAVAEKLMNMYEDLLGGKVNALE